MAFSGTSIPVYPPGYAETSDWGAAQRARWTDFLYKHRCCLNNYHAIWTSIATLALVRGSHWYPSFNEQPALAEVICCNLAPDNVSLLKRAIVRAYREPEYLASLETLWRLGGAQPMLCRIYLPEA